MTVARKHARRLVPFCATLRAWLTASRRTSEHGEPIVPPNWVEASKSIRRRAGWDVAARLLDAPRGAWPANVCRHTCASVQVAIGTPLDDLAFKFGHSGGKELLRKHYVARLTRNDALTILAVGPGGSTIPLVGAPEPDLRRPFFSRLEQRTRAPVPKRTDRRLPGRIGHTLGTHPTL